MLKSTRYYFLPANIAFVLLLFAGCNDSDQKASKLVQPTINVDANAKLYREYAGPFGAGVTQGKCGVQVFVLEEQYWMVSYPNGLPGAGWRAPGKVTFKNAKPAKDGIIEFTDGEMFYAVDLNNDTVSARGGDWATMLKRVEREDPVIPGREKGGAPHTRDDSED